MPWCSWRASVEVLAASPGPTRAGDLVLLNGELVVVGELLSPKDPPQGKDNDVLLPKDVHHAGVTVWLHNKDNRMSDIMTTLLFYMFISKERK